MILKELNLIGFGKFNNKKLNLENGINLIYGENESGKSTIHSFIDGMFYGFLRPNVRSALYTDEHKRYDPLNSNRYIGSLKFKHEGKEYRIEREFTKGKESTRVLEEDTALDITKFIDVGSGRILQPGIHFFGFSTNVFSNTISIKQLDAKTDDRLAMEVTEKLINVTTAMDDDISVDNALLELKSSIEEIGTERAYTRPYARNIKKIKELEDEKKRIELEKNEYESYLEEKIKLSNNLAIEEESYNTLTKDLSKAKIVKKSRILEEAKGLSEEIRKMESNIMEPSSYESFIEEDYNKYEEIEEKKNRILYNERGRDLELLKRDYKFNQGKIRSSIIFLFVILIGLIVTLVINQLVFGLPLGLISFYFIFEIIKFKKITDKLQDEIYNMETEEKKRNIEISNMEELQNQLLSQYNVNTKIEFKGLVSIIQMRKYSREESINQLEIKKDLLIRILDNTTIEELTLEIEGANIDLKENIDEDKLEYDMEKSKEKIIDIKMELKVIEANIKILEKGISRLVEIEEELYRKKVYKKDLDDKLKSLDLVIATIEELSKDIHSEFAPVINKKVSETVGKITNGKYTNIRVSEELDISVENPITKEIININSLSGGTIDQLYFALRFGIINSMEENKFPLILDDCFIQYDDNRLKNILRFLSDIGRERQIILFTCQHRERRIMEEIGIKFNLLNLT